MQPSQNLSLPSRIYPLFQPLYMCDPPRIYPSLPEYTLPFSINLYVRPSENLHLPPRIYPPFQQIYMCDPSRTYPSNINWLKEGRVYSGREGLILGGLHNFIVVEKGDIFWEGGVYSGRIGYSCSKGGGGIFWRAG